MNIQTKIGHYKQSVFLYLPRQQHSHCKARNRNNVFHLSRIEKHTTSLNLRTLTHTHTLRQKRIEINPINLNGTIMFLRYDTIRNIFSLSQQQHKRAFSTGNLTPDEMYWLKPAANVVHHDKHQLKVNLIAKVSMDYIRHFPTHTQIHIATAGTLRRMLLPYIM